MEKEAHQRLNILVVDDKKIVGDLFALMLGEEVHNVTVSYSAEEAIALVHDRSFDLVFLDIVMPYIDGVKALEEIKRIKPDLPVIMMSGFTVESKRNRIKDLGAVTCLDKPVEKPQIREVVKIALGKDI